MLGDDAPLGKRLVEYLGLPDTVFDVEVTANRGDCLSMVGIAREVATLFGKELRLPEVKKTESVVDTNYCVSVKIETPEICNRFAAVVFDGFQLGNSPVWMQQRLLRAGMRSINNLVDITNYVMLEIGQPTHAYDTTQVENQSFVVRTAIRGEKLQTLDKKVFELSDEMLVVADSEKNIGIAGVMGGESSKITQDTHSLLLEIANFDPVNIRRTGMKLGIRSDAIVRFERGVDREMTLLALYRINYLLATLAGAHQASAVVDMYPTPIEKTEVSLRSHLLDMYLGVKMAFAEVEKTLNSLGFATVSKAGDDVEWLLTVSVPSWRYRDVAIEEDLIEEVARIYGYDNLPISTPVGKVPVVQDNKRLRVKRRTLELMKGLGWQEVLTYSFNSKEQVEQSGYSVSEALEMVTPLSEEHRYMRLSLLPNLLWIVQKNLVLSRDLQLFELSGVYHRRLFDLIPDEAVSLGLEPTYFSGIVSLKTYSFDGAYGTVLSTLRSVFDRLDVRNVRFVQDNEVVRKVRTHGMYHPGRVGAFMLGEKVIGLFGEIHPALAEKLGLKQSMFMWELFYDSIVDDVRLVTAFEQYSIYPATTESLSFIMDETQAVGPIVVALRALDDRIVSAVVSKPYKGDQIELGKQAVTFTFVYQAKDGVVKDKDASVMRTCIVQLVKNEFNGRLRDSNSA